ncbi:sugar phosphate isomerase/epimerase [Candidatus Pacearchaeota archaeon]|nr:sugar phosphate isomerase/epimerase [Candidatus Pacearchaeota archaeon]
MKYSERFYSGADYGLDPNHGNPINHYVSTSSIGSAINPQTANQLKATSDALNTGTKTVEVQMTFAEVAKAIPNQHLEEIHRLKKLVGADLTLHGPMIEPTGINPQGGSWDENQRIQAERQIWEAVERGHKIDPDGNIVVTMHASHSLPEPRTRIINDQGEEETTNLYVIDERTGSFGTVPKPKKDYLFGEKKDIDTELNNINEQRWEQKLSEISLPASRGREFIGEVNKIFRDTENTNTELRGKKAEEIYAKSLTPEGQKFLNDLSPESRKAADQIINGMGQGDVYIRESYRRLKDAYNEAYEIAEKKDDQKTMDKLGQFREEVAPLMNEYKDDKSKIVELSEAISKGVRILDSVNAPESYKPLDKFAIEKSAETFANVAFKGFEKFGETAPILSIENPPVGMGLTRAEELSELIKQTKEKFVKKAVKELDMTKKEAEKEAEKLIGATWDVGHINMLRQYGYKEEHLKEQFKKMAPFIKHVHLSDNFGMSHSELPMGMGNVPMKEYEKLLSQYGKKVEDIKRIIETGDWIQHFGAVSPYGETLSAFGTPVYAASRGSYWNQASGASGGYFAGQGAILPDIHFQTYGTGFSNLPVELGGQMSGRNRLSGSPME